MVGYIWSTYDLGVMDKGDSYLSLLSLSYLSENAAGAFSSSREKTVRTYLGEEREMKTEERSRPMP